jgi:hypothetical protein
MLSSQVHTGGCGTARNMSRQPRESASQTVYRSCWHKEQAVVLAKSHSDVYTIMAVHNNGNDVTHLCELHLLVLQYASIHGNMPE